MSYSESSEMELRLTGEAVEYLELEQNREVAEPRVRFHPEITILGQRSIKY